MCRVVDSIARNARICYSREWINEKKKITCKLETTAVFWSKMVIQPEKDFEKKSSKPSNETVFTFQICICNRNGFCIEKKGRGVYVPCGSTKNIHHHLNAHTHSRTLAQLTNRPLYQTLVELTYIGVLVASFMLSIQSSTQHTRNIGPRSPIQAHLPRSDSPSNRNRRALWPNNITYKPTTIGYAQNWRERVRERETRTPIPQRRHCMERRKPGGTRTELFAINECTSIKAINKRTNVRLCVWAIIYVCAFVVVFSSQMLKCLEAIAVKSVELEIFRQEQPPRAT